MSGLSTIAATLLGSLTLTLCVNPARTQARSLWARLPGRLV